jgi:hypothetical protein
MKKVITVLFLLCIAMTISCSSGGGGSSSGGGVSSQTIVGTWTLTNSTGGTWPQKAVFNSDGTGQFSGGSNFDGAFTWTQQGSQVIITQGGRTIATINNVTPPIPNNVSLSSGGLTAIYSRA